MRESKTISNNQSFSVEDIRRIREEDDKRRRNMIPSELARDIREAAKEGHKIIAELRQQKKTRRG